jgi:replicative DNA helicase
VANVEFYAEHVKAASKRRRLKKLAEDTLIGLEQDTDADVVLEQLEQEVTGFDRTQTHARLLRDIFPDAIARLEELHKADGGLTGIPSGLMDLDAMTNGFQDQDLIIIAARASIGKTALALQIANNIWFKAHVPIGFFSCEMGAESLILRMLSSELRIEHQRVRKGRMTPADFNRVVDFGGKVHDARYWIDDSPSIKLQDLKSSARRMVRQGAEILIVDYLTLIRHGDTRMPRHERVGAISKSLKNLARELDVPIIALSQLGRDAEGSRPTLANLRQSGEIEEDADVVILMNRDRQAPPDGVQDVELIVAKHRNGPTGNVTVELESRFTRFDDKLMGGGDG